MRLLTRLERVLGRFAIPHLPLALVVCQVVVYIVVQGMNARPEVQRGLVGPAQTNLELIPNAVLDGEVWRVFSFLMLPPFDNVLVALLAWYFFWMTGTAVEQVWGTFRFNVYLLVGWAATVGAAFLTPDQPATNAFLNVGVLLAFAWMVPDFRIFLYFVLPIPIRWVAYATWAGLLLTAAVGSWATKAQAVASVANFLLFFGRDIVEALRTSRRRVARQTAAFVAEAKQPEFYHQCRACGITDRTHPKMDFRYCSKCVGSPCYCADHLKSHEHVATTGGG